MPTHPQDFNIDVPDLDWTTSLPMCPYSRLSTSTNQIYYTNGYKKDEHPFYETGFSFLQDSVFVYGLFSGHRGNRVAKFAASMFPAELMLGQLSQENLKPEQVHSILRVAFTFVDKQYMASLDDLLLEKATREMDSMDESMVGSMSSMIHDPDRSQHIQQELSVGACALICTILDNKMYMAYVGECVGVLCKGNSTSQADAWEVNVLTVAHTIGNDDEAIRLGPHTITDLDIAGVKHTRFLGNFTLKDRGIPELVVDPEILTVPVTSDWKFLVIASPGVFEALTHLNPDSDMKEMSELLCSLVRDECSRYSDMGDLNSVVQKVVEEIGRQHFMAFSDKKIKSARRPDMTLLIRIFDERVFSSGSTDSLSSQGTLSNTLSSMYGTRPVPDAAGNGPISPYVDFTAFVEKATADEAFPREWLSVDGEDLEKAEVVRTDQMAEVTISTEGVHGDQMGVISTEEVPGDQTGAVPMEGVPLVESHHTSGVPREEEVKMEVEAQTGDPTHQSETCDTLEAV